MASHPSRRQRAEGLALVVVIAWLAIPSCSSDNLQDVDLLRDEPGYFMYIDSAVPELYLCESISSSIPPECEGEIATGRNLAFHLAPGIEERTTQENPMETEGTLGILGVVWTPEEVVVTTSSDGLSWRIDATENSE